MINKVQEIFNKRNPGFIGQIKESAVSILLYEREEETYIVFEVRSLNLRHQPGDVCLPGGRLEDGEAPRECAIRETIEELNIRRDDVEYIGAMDVFVSSYNSIIYPFIFKIRTIDITPNTEEVDHCFFVPLSYFMTTEPEKYEYEVLPKIPDNFPYHMIIGGKSYKFSNSRQTQYFYKFENHVIWGFTALLIKSFIDVIKNTAT